MAEQNKKLTEQKQNLIEQNKILKENNHNLTKLNQALADKKQKLIEQNQKLTEHNQILTEQKEDVVKKLIQVRKQNNKQVGTLIKQNQELIEQLERCDTNQEVISNQVEYNKRWISSIDYLENHMYNVIKYCQLKKKESCAEDKEEMAILENKIGCSVDEDDDDIVIPNTIEVIMKLKRESN